MKGYLHFVFAMGKGNRIDGEASAKQYPFMERKEKG